MPTFGKEEAPEAIFEEHRFSMPFVSAEVEMNEGLFGIAMHTLPTQVPYGNKKDQSRFFSMQSDGLFTCKLKFRIQFRRENR